MAWDWQVFCKETTTGEVVASCFGRGGDITYLNWILSAWGWTLSVAVLALIVALVAGSLVGIMRTLPSAPMVFFGNVWTEMFRNIPLLVQIFLWYHVLPAIVPVLKGFPSFVLVVFALGFFTSARIAEQVRAGIQSLPRGQRYAGLAMGLTLGQTYRYVLLPMAFRIVIPPLTSESMNIIKNSSVAFAVSIAELTMFAMHRAKRLRARWRCTWPSRAVLHLGLRHQPRRAVDRKPRARARHDRGEVRHER
jgi:glutamate/aspartate transport system permease protein